MSQIRPCSFSLDILTNSWTFIPFFFQICFCRFITIYICALLCWRRFFLSYNVWCFHNEKLKAGIIDLHCVIILKIKRRMLTHKSRLFLIFHSRNPCANNGWEQRKSWRWMQTNINRHCLCLSVIFFDYYISLFNHGTISLPKKQCNFIRMLTTTAVFHFFRDLKSSLSKSA